MKYKTELKFIVSFLFLLLFCASTLSYYADYHSIVNEFTVGDIKIDLTEKIFESAENTRNKEEVTPGWQFIKDPEVKNTGKSDCFVFVEITIPKTERIFVNKAGKKLPVMSREVFTYTVNPEWMLIDEKISATEAKRVYAFTSGSNLAPLRPGEEISVIDKGVFKTACFIETGLCENYEIPVIAYAIETTDILNNDENNTEGIRNPLQVFNIIINQKACEKRVLRIEE